MLHPSPVYGPVRSRRLGLSLGINLLPAESKVCTFDCLYCELGLNASYPLLRAEPTRSDVSSALRLRLLALSREGVRPDCLTFAGNGEPTLHEEFAEIMADVLSLRRELCPDAKVAVLTNGTLLEEPSVRSALLMADLPMVKLDSVSPDMVRLLNRPCLPYAPRDVVRRLSSPECRGKFAVQSMFLSSSAPSSPSAPPVDNTLPELVRPWLKALRLIRPTHVDVYTIDRPAAVEGLSKASPAVLESIAVQVRSLGIPCSVSC